MLDTAKWGANEWLVFSFLLTFTLAVAAIGFTTACSLVRVKPPDFFPAMIFILLINIAVSFVWLFLAIVMGLAMQADLTSASEVQGLMMMSWPIALVLSPFISAAIYTVLLPECGILKGLLIWVLQIVVLAVVFAVIVVLYLIAQQALTPKDE
jgi:hypothetical protein